MFLSVKINLINSKFLLFIGFYWKCEWMAIIVIKTNMAHII